MNRLPGFTADASFGKKNAGYRNRCDSVTADSAQVIIAQNWLGDLGRQMVHDLEGVADLLFGVADCALATAKMGKSCAEGMKTGDGSDCANDGEEFIASCFGG
jgi:hypothetical protein